MNLALAQLNLGNDGGDKIEFIELTATGGFVFLHNFGGEGETFIGTLKIGPSAQFRCLLRPSQISWYDGSGFLLGFSYNYSTHDGQSFSSIDKECYSGSNAIPLYALNAKRQRIGIETGLYVAIGDAKQGSFEILLSVNKVKLKAKLDGLSISAQDGYIPNNNPSIAKLEYFGWGTDYAFNFSISEKVAIRWDIGVNFLEESNGSAYSSVGISVGIF